MIYQPMLELLQNLLKHGYNTFFVSGGGVDLMRAWVEEVYGIQPHQVVGSVGVKVYSSFGEEYFHSKPQSILLRRKTLRGMK
jgi:hypothetical protein